MGNSLVIYTIANTLGKYAAGVFIDAPLKVLLGDADGKYIATLMPVPNASGTPVNGYLLTLVLVANDYICQHGIRRYRQPVQMAMPASCYAAALSRRYLSLYCCHSTSEKTTNSV